MRKLTIAAGAVALILGGLLLPSLAQHTGRTITRETLSESSDFVRAGGHVLNRSHIAYVAQTGVQTTVYFVGNVPPLVLTEGGDELAAQLAPGDDPRPAPMPVTRPPGGNWERRPSKRIESTPGSPVPDPELKALEPPSDPTLTPVAPPTTRQLVPAPPPAPDPSQR